MITTNVISLRRLMLFFAKFDVMPPKR